MPAKFVLTKARGGKFRFELLASNGKVLTQSMAYDTKRAAVAALQSVQKNAASAVVDDQSEPAKKATAAKTAAAKTTARKTTAKRTAAKSSANSSAAKSTAAPASSTTARKATGQTAAEKTTAQKTARKRVAATTATES